MPLSLTRSQRSAAARRRALLEMRPGDTCSFAPTVRRPRSAGACLAQGGGQEPRLSAGPGPTGPQLGSPLWACLLPERLGQGPCSGTGDGDPGRAFPTGLTSHQRPGGPLATLPGLLASWRPSPLDSASWLKVLSADSRRPEPTQPELH